MGRAEGRAEECGGNKVLRTWLMAVGRADVFTASPKSFCLGHATAMQPAGDPGVKKIDRKEKRESKLRKESERIEVRV